VVLGWLPTKQNYRFREPTYKNPSRQPPLGVLQLSPYLSTKTNQPNSAEYLLFMIIPAHRNDAQLAPSLISFRVSRLIRSLERRKSGGGGGHGSSSNYSYSDGDGSSGGDGAAEETLSFCKVERSDVFSCLIFNEDIRKCIFRGGRQHRNNILGKSVRWSSGRRCE
jgi:hypothetical protein